jgi:hypothetical protein
MKKVIWTENDGWNEFKRSEARGQETTSRFRARGQNIVVLEIVGQRTSDLNGLMERRALYGQSLGYSRDIVLLRTARNMVGKPPSTLVNKGKYGGRLHKFSQY